MATLFTSLCARVAAFTALGAVVGVGAIAAGASDGPTQDPPSSTRTTAYTGEALFRGIALGAGEVAGKLPEIWSNASRRDALTNGSARTSSELADQLDEDAIALANQGFAAELVDAIRARASAVRASPSSVSDDSYVAVREAVNASVVAFVRAKDPAFFASFESAVQSGDAARIDRALTRFAALVTSRRAAFVADGRCPSVAYETDTLLHQNGFLYLRVAAMINVAALARPSLGVGRTVMARLIGDRFARA